MSFMITNHFKQQDRFSISCYKVAPNGDVKTDCLVIPGMVVLSPNARRKVKVKLETPEDGLYRVCSIEEPDENEYKSVITRVCATLGVGIDPNTGAGKRPKHRATADAVAARQRPH